MLMAVQSIGETLALDEVALTACRAALPGRQPHTCLASTVSTAHVQHQLKPHRRKARVAVALVRVRGRVAVSQDQARLVLS